MAKENSHGKRAKITQAQKNMILAVFGASIFLGAAIAVVINSLNRIAFNAEVIVAEDQSIVAFSDTIKNIGICRRPSGQVYTDDELAKCNPNGVDVESVPGTLRSNILENMASNSALLSVPNQNNKGCINPSTGKNYTYKELEDNYDKAESDEDLMAASALIKSCSALRVIPDALPSSENEIALLTSVDQIFRDSGTEPESLSPTEETEWATFGTNLFGISVRLSIEESAGTVMQLLNNLERSIRNFNINSANIEYSSGDTITFQGRGTAYYMTESGLTLSDKNIKAGGS